MEENGFSHIEGSSYTSKQRLPYYKIENIVLDLVEEYPYLAKCIRDIRCTKVQSVYSLGKFFDYDRTPGQWAKDKKIVNEPSTQPEKDVSSVINTDAHLVEFDNIKANRQIIFDLDTKICGQILPYYQKAYADIQKYMKDINFAHIEGSSYCSIDKISSYRLQALVCDLVEEYPYLAKCVRDSRCTKIGRESRCTVGCTPRFFVCIIRKKLSIQHCINSFFYDILKSTDC